ncbi:MAG: hypothetical protein KJ732_04760, partial [Candidatus Margulisbacteria bacterium]|nr:hypothetical protein [Candidatus Margulisiibacteriota bacterium]
LFHFSSTHFDFLLVYIYILPPKKETRTHFTCPNSSVHYSEPFFFKKENIGKNNLSSFYHWEGIWARARR